MISGDIKAFAARDAVGRPAAPPLALIAAATAIGFSALHMVVPALPMLAAEFARDAAEVQLVLTLYFLGIAAGQLFYGPVADRYGRRPVLLAGLGLFLAGTVLCGAAPTLPLLVAGRVLQAVGGCAGLVLGRAIIRDVSDRDGAARGIALVMMVMSLAPMISPAIGAFASQWFGWRAMFVLLGGFGAFVLVWTLARLAETLPQPVPFNLRQLCHSYALFGRSGPFACFALCTAFTSASWFTFIASAPYLLSETLHEPPTTYGALILLPMIAYVLGNGAAARFSRRAGTNAMVVAGTGLSLFSGLWMAVWCLWPGLSPLALFAPIALSSVGNGLSQPTAMASALSVYPRVAGTASGLVGCSQMAVSALGTILVGMLPHGGPFAMVGVIVGTQIVACLFGALALRLPMPAAADAVAPQQAA
ncbi:MAG: multidrug effflux MFS transporter [Alphaproteobacteria bacterium]|nr:multidrug effflux MFS transporter [Alphaproteobacteria bacterium]